MTSTEKLHEEFVASIMENFPEASSPSLCCIGWRYKKLEFQFFDVDGSIDEKKHIIHLVDRPKLFKALELMHTDKWPKGCTPFNAATLTDWTTAEDWLCCADATDFDAFIQLAIFGEVVYG